MKVNRRLMRFLKRNMFFLEEGNRRILLIRPHRPFMFIWTFINAISLSNEYNQRYN